MTQICKDRYCTLYYGEGREDLVVKEFKNNKLWSLKQEAVYLHKLEGVRGVQRLFGACVDPPWLITFYCGLDLEDYLACYRVPMLRKVAILRKVFRTMEIIHSRGILHNSIKLANICVHLEKRKVYIIDFGNATGIGKKASNKKAGFSMKLLRLKFPRIAPEVLAGEPSLPASDVWSLSYLA